MASHREALGRVARDTQFADQVQDDYTKADLTPRERAIADHAVKITRTPDACSPADIDLLRGVGLGDDDVLSLSLIVAYQNMSTRIMESMSTVD